MGTTLKSPLPFYAGALIAAGVALWFFPLFHLVPLASPATATAIITSAPAGFDAAAAAQKLWQSDLPAAAAKATELKTLAPALRANAADAQKKFAHAAGLGTAYYFVRGSGRVVAHERSTLRIALDGAADETVTVRIGPIFGNTVRDGCGLLDVNSFPGLTEFNALSTELNGLVEKNVLPSLRERAVVGATVTFVGCAEAPESVDAGEPLLLIVPIQAEVR